MKPFKGSILAGAALLLLWLGLHFMETEADPETEGLVIKAVATSLFRFEKQDVVRIEVRRPEDSLVLSSGSDGWTVEPGGFPASRSMVSRVKHQLHDLDARAQVIVDPDAFALYGLGPQAIEVSVSLRDGKVIRFAGGDPNPSSVSYYIRPLPGDVVYTVKKSALDFYSFTIDSFREPRFAIFDAKDVVRMEADLPQGKRLVFQREGESNWQMLEPLSMDAEADRVRALLGRVGALKAREFVREIEVGDDTDLGLYGLMDPVARIQISFGSRDPIDLRIGRNVSDKEDENHAYMMMGDGPSIYTARRGLLEDYTQDPQNLRNRAFMPLLADDLREIEIHLTEQEEGDPAGRVLLKLVSDSWKWDDGRPVPGSTPKRVAARLTGIRANGFVDDAKEIAKAKLKSPLATVRLTDAEGRIATLLLGQKGPPVVDDLEDRELERYYAKLEGGDQVYLVDKGILSVLKDAVREHNRKLGKDEEQLERREAIEEAMKDEK
jgi:hypothetical protein